MRLLETALNHAVEKTLAEMAFIDTRPEEKTTVDYTNILVTGFTEPARVWLYVFMPLNLKKQIVENIYGETWSDLSDVDIDDCLLEIVNVLAGNFLMDYYGEDTEQELVFPSVQFEKNSRREGYEVKKAYEFYFNAEGFPFRINYQEEN